MNDFVFKVLRRPVFDADGNLTYDVFGDVATIVSYVPVVNGRQLPGEWSQQDYDEFEDAMIHLSYYEMVRSEHESLIDTLNAELDDETKMRLVMAMPLLQEYLVATDND